jgi:integrase
MSLENSITTSNYINYDEALNKGRELMQVKSSRNFGFYIIVAINTGRRIGDILSMTRTDFENGYKDFREQKTNKVTRLDFNPKIMDAFKEITCIGEKVFTSTHGSTYSVQQINRKLKQAFQHKRKKISSHSLRKSFGRRVYEKNGESESSLVKLSQMFNHSSVAITRDYLDITQEELQDIYINL